MSNNKERLGQRFGIHTWEKPQINETGSKSRFDKTPPTRLGDSRGSPLRKKSGSPPQTQGIRKKSGSPLRQKSGSPIRTYLP